MLIHVPSNQSVREGGTKEEKSWKDLEGLEPRMEHTVRQVDNRFRVGAWGQRGAERWTRLIRDPKGMRKFVPQLRCVCRKERLVFPFLVFSRFYLTVLLFLRYSKLGRVSKGEYGVAETGFLQAKCRSCRANNSIKAYTRTHIHTHTPF